MTKVHSYHQGDYFGDLALLSSKTRSATIFSTSECHFAVLYKQDFKKLLQKFEMKYESTNVYSDQNVNDPLK